MAIFQNLLGRFQTIRELLRFFIKVRKWWLIPFVLFLVIVGLILIFAQSSPIAPILYTIF